MNTVNIIGSGIMGMLSAHELLKKGFKKLYTKEDGSLNVLGKFFNAKSLADVMK